VIRVSNSGEAVQKEIGTRSALFHGHNIYFGPTAPLPITKPTHALACQQRDFGIKRRLG